MNVVVPEWIHRNQRARDRAAVLQRERDRYLAMLHLCHEDIDPACPFDEWLIHLDRLLELKEKKEARDAEPA